VVEYFDAFLVGLTATPSKQTLGFFNKNLVMEYDHARAVADGGLVLMPNADVELTLERLRTLPGVGEWTAQVIAMRALAWPDAFPHTDLGVMKALGTRDVRRVLAAGEAWRPWRAYAVMHLWNSLAKD